MLTKKQKSSNMSMEHLTPTYRTNLTPSYLQSQTMKSTLKKPLMSSINISTPQNKKSATATNWGSSAQQQDEENQRYFLEALNHISLPKGTEYMSTKEEEENEEQRQSCNRQELGSNEIKAKT